MTVPTAAPPTLADVRQRFVQAEASLVELAGTLESLRKSQVRFGDAAASVQQANERLLVLGGQLATAVGGIATCTELLRQAVEAQAKAEPVKLAAAIEISHASLSAGLAALTSLVASVRWQILLAVAAGAGVAIGSLWWRP